MSQTTTRRSKSWKILGPALALLMIVAGCASMKSNPPGVPEDPVQGSDTGPLPSDFNDIRVPRALEPIKDQTFFMHTGSFSAGVLSLRGRVDCYSLVSFFESQMKNDNWRLVGFFKSVRSLMMFHKENRWCVINITEKNFYTYVEIWVAPTLQDAGPID